MTYIFQRKEMSVAVEIRKYDIPKMLTQQIAFIEKNKINNKLYIARGMIEFSHTIPIFPFVFLYFYLFVRFASPNKTRLIEILCVAK